MIDAKEATLIADEANTDQYQDQLERVEERIENAMHSGCYAVCMDEKLSDVLQAYLMKLGYKVRCSSPQFEKGETTIEWGITTR